MGKNSLTPAQAEKQRRQVQSLRDREEHRRQQQSARDRESNRRQRELSLHISHQILREQIGPSIGTHSVIPPSSIMPQTIPCEVESNSGITFARLFRNAQYSDVTVYLGESKVPFAAHQVVLGTRCPYFRDVFRGGFKEGLTKEISFEKDSAHALWRVLCYLYTGDYSDEPAETLASERDDLELFKHLRVFALADMLRIEDLKMVACRKFARQLEQHWISDTLPDCVREVYSTTNSVESNGLRIAVVNAVALHETDLVNKGPFQDLIREGGDFAVDLVLEMAGISSKWG